MLKEHTVRTVGAPPARQHGDAEIAEQVTIRTEEKSMPGSEHWLTRSDEAGETRRQRDKRPPRRSHVVYVPEQRTALRPPLRRRLPVVRIHVRIVSSGTDSC
jgi:hypothetical protein